MSELQANDETKTEVVAAYQELLRKLTETKRVSPIEEKKNEERMQIVKTHAKEEPETLAKSFENLKVALLASVTEVKEKVLAEQKKLSHLQEAIEYKSKQLAGIDELEMMTEALTQLRHKQEEENLDFERNLQEKRRALEREIDQQQNAFIEEMAQKKRELQQDELKSKHQLELSKQKDLNLHQIKMRDLDKEITNTRLAFQQEMEERESRIRSSEWELEQLNQLKEQVAQYPQQLQEAVQEARDSVMQQLTEKYNYETQLLQKEIKLNEQTIATLETKIAMLESNLAHFASLKNSLNRILTNTDESGGLPLV